MVKRSVPFEFSARLRPNNELEFILQGRLFSLSELKRSVIASCKGYINEFYTSCWGLYLWEIIEAVELVADLQDTSEDRDFFEGL